jgi:hypothetical protein
MSKKKQRVTLQDLGRLPITQPKTNGYESGPELWNRLQQEERDAQAAAERAAYLKTPQGKFEAEITAALRENQTSVKKFWSLPLEGPDGMEKYSPSEAPVDGGLDVPPATEQWMLASVSRVYDLFADEMKAASIGLSPAGACRLQRYFLKTADIRKLDCSEASWWKALERLYSLGCFRAGEIVRGENVLRQRTQVASPAAPELTEQQKRQQLEAEIEATPTDTREGERKCIAVLDSLWSRDVVNMYRQFAEFMDKTYGANVLTDKIAREYGSFCDRWNLNPIAATTLNKWRVELDRRNIFPFSLLTEEEKLAQSIENSDLSSRDVRMNIARRTLDIAAAK